jgi:hypothetical protein
MRTPVNPSTLGMILALASPLGAVDLKLDINQRSATNNVPANTEGGYLPWVITNPATGVVQGATANTITSNGVTVSITGTGSANSCDDRKRLVPTNAPPFDQQALLQDFIFATYVAGTNVNAGLNIAVSGLTPGKEYAITLWSYDNSSAGTRVSDWSVNGAIVVDDYTFDGRTLPLSNEQYQINFTGIADAGGNLLIQGLRDGTSLDANGAASHGVFLNALWIRDLFVDVDNDLIPDGWETAHGLDPAINDAALDPDNDTSTNLDEYHADTDPQDQDTDDDGLLDGYEKKTGTWVSPLNAGTNPLSIDTDGDGLSDGVENPDLPWTGPAQPGTDPNKYDTDGDLMGDGTEVNWPSSPRNPLEFPHPGEGGTLSVDLENTTSAPQPGFEAFAGTTDEAATTVLTNTYGSRTVTITAVGGTTLRSRDRAAAGGGGDFNPLFRDFIYTDNSDLDGEGMDVTITGLEPLTYYPVTLWSWDPTSAGSPAEGRRSTWLASNGDDPAEVKVPLYVLTGATPLPATPSDRRMQFLALSNSAGELVIQGRKETGYFGSTINVFLNAFVLGAAVPDSDDDLMPDEWESANNLDPQVNDAALDADEDGLLNLAEFRAGTDPQDEDSDDDTLKDGVEKKTGVWAGITNTGTDPIDPDTDNDGLPDGLENPDLAYAGPAQPGTDPNKYDTDGDEFGDGTEVNWPTDPESELEFPNPALGATLAVDLEDISLFPQRGFEALIGSGTTDFNELGVILGPYNITISAAGTTGLQSRDRAAAAGGGDFNPLFRDFVFSTNSMEDGDGMDLTITGLAPLTLYPVTLWSWDPSSTATPRRSTWYSLDGGFSPVVKVPLYSLQGTARPAGPQDRRMQFTAATDATGKLVIQGRKEDGYVSTATAQVFLNAFIIGAPQGPFVPPGSDIVITALGPHTPDGLTITWTSEAGARYKVEAAPNLADWGTLNDNVTGQEGTTSYTDTTAAGAPERFYRVSRVTP